MATDTLEIGGKTEAQAELFRLDWPALLTGLGLWLIFVALLAYIQFASLNLTGNDDYFHIKFAQIMRQQGLRPPFPWLPLTILNEAEYFDHHFLYHVLLIPFTYGDLLVGAKWAAIIFSAGAFVMGWVLLRGQSVPYAALWALGFLAVSEAFLGRMLMTRVQSVSLLMLLLMLHVTFRQRYRWLAPLAFIYTWLYDAFPLLFGMIGLYIVALWLAERRFEPAPLLYSALGVGLGLLINPYFPNNVVFIYHHFLPKVLDLTEAEIDVGNEWYPYRTWALVENSALALAALGVGALVAGLSERRMTGPATALFLISLFFGLLLFKSRRFVEYYPAFALLFCAVAWQPLLAEWRQRRTVLDKVVPVALALIFIPSIWFNVQAERTDLQEGTSYRRYAEASAWLIANSPPGSRVFNTDWDDFSQLFYYNTHNVYMLGLDPTYMAQYDPELYRVWRDTTQGWTKLGETIEGTFEANYVITDLDHYGFLDEAKFDSSLREVYRDEFAVIFIIAAG